MRYGFIAALLLFVFTNNSPAQTNHYSSARGSWKVIPYAPNVVKLVFQPNGYTHDENVTGAVLATRTATTNVQAAPAAGLVKWAGKQVQPTAVKDSAGNVFFRFQLQPGEKIFGGGERALPLNRRGYRFPLYNNPWYGYSMGADALNFSVPFFTSSNGYALFFDNASRGVADIGKSDPAYFDVGFESGELNMYVIFGNSYKTILSSYHKLTGTQPLPPRWAMGNLMSRFGYTSEAQVEEIAGKMRAEHMPFDAIIFDLFWFGDSIKNTLGNLDWVNKTKWPQPGKMISDFKEEHINTVLITEPFILKGTKTYQAAQPYLAVDSAGKAFNLTDFYFGYGGLLDIFRKDAGNWIWNNHYKKQIRNGVAGWWTDLGEPEKHPAGIRHNLKDLGIKRLMGADEVHNIYGHYWNKMLSDHYKAEYPRQRLFHLNRSGFAGSQRYSIFPWSGDVSRSWSGLQAQVPLMLGMSMSGIPYIHADAGGFAGGEGDNELYIRWLQFAAFTPVFRPHGTALYQVDPNAYSFPSEPALIDPAYRNFARQSVWLRYSMLPYNYTLAYKQAASGEPLVAPLYYYFPADTTAINVNDEFMWGENILVAPVLEKGTGQRQVYLPGGRWYSFFDSSRYQGNGWTTQRLSMDHIPAFVKEGSFITIATPGSGDSSHITTNDFTADNYQVIYYPASKSSTGELYLDDGITRNAASEIIRFKGIARGNTISIVVSTNHPERYKKGFSRQLTIGTFEPVNETKPATSNGKLLNAAQLKKMTVSFNPAAAYNALQLNFKGQPLQLNINLSEN